MRPLFLFSKFLLSAFVLTLTFIADGTLPANGLVLCNTTRSLAELDVKFNHRRVISIEQLAVALGSGAAALAQDFANQRNTLSLKARRGVDFNGTAFGDPEAALLFALDQPGQFLTTGTLQMDLTGAVTVASTRYLLNCGVEGISLADWLGVAPAFDYTFNGGLITPNSPF
jgi:hypothetical protein